MKRKPYRLTPFLRHKLSELEGYSELKNRILYYVKTRVIDEMVCKQRGIDFNEKLADQLDGDNPFYIVIRKDLGIFTTTEKELKELYQVEDLPTIDLDDEARRAIRFFIKPPKN